jgi:hypothetical protein
MASKGRFSGYDSAVEKTGPSLAARAVAVVVLVVAAWVMLKVVLGIVAAVAWTVVTILAIVAVIWALRVLL